MSATRLPVLLAVCRIRRVGAVDDTAQAMAPTADVARLRTLADARLIDAARVAESGDPPDPPPTRGAPRPMRRGEVDHWRRETRDGNPQAIAQLADALAEAADAPADLRRAAVPATPPPSRIHCRRVARLLDRSCASPLTRGDVAALTAAQRDALAAAVDGGGEWLIDPDVAAADALRAHAAAARPLDTRLAVLPAAELLVADAAPNRDAAATAAAAATTWHATWADLADVAAAVAA